MTELEKEYTPVVDMDHATPRMKDLREMEERINKRFDGIDSRLDKMDEKLDKLIEGKT